MDSWCLTIILFFSIIFIMVLLGIIIISLMNCYYNAKEKKYQRVYDKYPVFKIEEDKIRAYENKYREYRSTYKIERDIESTTKEMNC